MESKDVPVWRRFCPKCGGKRTRFAAKHFNGDYYICETCEPEEVDAARKERSAGAVVHSPLYPSERRPEAEVKLEVEGRTYLLYVGENGTSDLFGAAIPTHRALVWDVTDEAAPRVLRLTPRFIGSETAFTEGAALAFGDAMYRR